VGEAGDAGNPTPPAGVADRMDLISRLRLLATFGKGMARGLPDASSERDPIELLREWYDAAEHAGLFLPDALALATSTPYGAPSVRMVLLKGLDEDGLVFYTNYESRKARELDENPRAAMCFHWAVLQRQVRMSGPVARIPAAESDAYFVTRPRGSQIGAWASEQSRPLVAREELRAKFEEFGERFEDSDVPRPDFWGGYRLTPFAIEFWQGRPDRLHDRLLFERADADAPWSTRRLNP